MMNFTIFAGIR